MSVNKVILIGNVGSDPIIKDLENDLKVANFSLATSENYTAKDGTKVTSTEWHNIVAWRGLAKITEQYIKKGTQIYIEGKIKSRSYDNKDNIKIYISEIYADTIQLTGRKPEASREIPPEGKSDECPY